MKLPSRAAIAGLILMAATQSPLAAPLIVNGTVDQSGIFLSSGMLSGDGVINAPVTLDSQFGGAATVAPGNSPGILTINDDVDILNGSILSVEIGGLVQGTEYDLLDVFGTATLDASTIIELIGFGGFVPEVGDAFDILQANTLIAGPAFTLNLLNEAALFNWDASVVDIDGGRQALRVTAISAVPVATPVPASLLLLVSGGGAALLAARRRTVH